ncbi:MAG: hypothetical protein DWQ29_15485 [Planctomycetota bacterium]|nr:MAG: hypothetical protein DWQ29_15485 [Planctomycetota bacterium]
MRGHRRSGSLSGERCLAVHHRTHDSDRRRSRQCHRHLRGAGMSRITIQEHALPDELRGSMVEYHGEHDDSASLQSHLAEHGYVLLRAALDRDDVLQARDEVFQRLAEVGEIGQPAIDGIATGTSRRTEAHADLHQFWKSVSEGEQLRRVTHGPPIRKLMSAVLGTAARPHDLIYLRPTAPGRVTRLHYDFPFFAGRSRRIHTAWVPLGDVPISDGPLVVVENSQNFDDLIEPMRNHDFASSHSNDEVQTAAYDAVNVTDPVTFCRERGVRLLSTDFRAGDVFIFGGFTLHGSLDNNSAVGRVRLSCDVRFQPADDPCDDPRYFGDDPRGSKGGGYGDMRGAQPLA